MKIKTIAFLGLSLLSITLGTASFLNSKQTEHAYAEEEENKEQFELFAGKVQAIISMYIWGGKVNESKMSGFRCLCGQR